MELSLLKRKRNLKVSKNGMRIHCCLGCERVLVSAIWGLERRNSRSDTRNDAFTHNDVAAGIETSYAKLHPERITISEEMPKRQSVSLSTKQTIISIHVCLCLISRKGRRERNLLGNSFYLITSEFRISVT